MEKLTYRFSLDVNKNGIQRTIQGIETGDKYAREVRITLRNGKEDYEFPSDDTIVASMYVKKPNSSTPSINTCTIEGNEIVYTLKDTDVNVMGTTIMQVKLVGTLRGGAEAVLVAPRFALEVWESETDDSEAEESTIYGSLENALAEAEAYYDERITGVTIEEDYTIKVTFADSTKTYTSDCLKTFHNEITSATSELTSTENRLTSQVTSLGNSLTSLATSETTKLDSQFASTSAKINSQVASTSSALTSEVASYGTSLSTAFTSESSAIASQFASESNAITSLFTSESNAIVSLFTSESNKIASQFASESAVLSSEVTSLGNKIDSESVATSTAISEVSSAFTSEITSMGSKIDSESTAFTSELTSTATYLESEIATKVNSASPSTSGTFTHTGNFTASGIIRSNMGIFADSIGGDTVYANNITANTTGGDITVDSNLILEQGLELDGLDLSNTLTALGSDITRNANDIADLKNKPSSALVLTSSSPLATSSASNILGIECEGKSTQDGTLVIGSFNYTWTSYSSVSGMFYTSNLFADYKPSDNNVKADIRCNIMNTITQADALSGTRGIAIDKNGALIVSDTSLVGKSYTEVNSVLNGLGAKVYTPYAPTPTNPLPIVDASGVVVAHTVNLYDENSAEKGKAISTTDGSLSNNSNVKASAFIEVIPNTSYTVSNAYDGLANVRVMAYTESKTFIQQINTTMNSNAITVEIPSNAKYVRFHCGINLTSVQIEQGTTASDYVAYQSNSINIFTIATLRSIGTVADTLVVKEDGSGVLTKRVGTVDLGTLTWTYDSTNRRFIASESTHKQTNRLTAILCNYYSTKCNGESYSADWDNVIYCGGENLIVHDRAYTDKDLFKASLTNCVCYVELATPTTTNLTSTQVASILALRTYNGTTIVDGEIVNTVTYSADVKGYVDSKCDYSYSDTIIGKWADGKDLHRMVISATTPSSANTSALVSDAINSDMCNLKDIKGTVDTGGGTIVSINSWFSSNNYVGTFLSTEGIKMKVGGYTSKPCEMTVEYTLNDESAIATLSEVSE